MTKRPVILVMLGCFTPALSASGPNSSLVEAVRALGDRFTFKVVAIADPGEEVGHWHLFDGCERIAVKPGIGLVRQLRRILAETPHDLVVGNGFFDHRLTLATLLIRRAGKLGSPLLLAPRGEFSEGALELSPLRKSLYRIGLKVGGLLDGLRYHATDEEEAARIGAILPGADVLVGPNIRTLTPLPPFTARAPDAPLRLAFASRIDRKKNLDWGLRLLARCDFPIQFDIHGPVSDPDYWRECERLIEAMPANVVVRACGVSPRAAMNDLLATYDLSFLPTRGENFGHAIADALLAGTPALIADTTPWRGLEAAHAGADLPLDDEGAWLDFLSRFAALTPAALGQWRSGARSYAEQRVDERGDIERLAACFTAAMQPGTVSNVRD